MNIKYTPILTLCAIAAGTLCAPLGRADLITNGGFCTSACTPDGDFTGWATSSPGDPYYTNTVKLAPGTYAAQIGAYYDDSANLIQGSILQSLATVVGQQYTINFLYGEYNANASTSDKDPLGQCGNAGCYLDAGNVTGSHDPDSNPWAQNNNLNVLLGGNSVFTDSNFFTSAIPSANNPDGGTSIGDYILREGTATITAVGTSTTLEFDASDYQQSVIITDVSAVANSPEPGTLGLLAFALPGLGLLARRRGFFARK